MRLTYPYYAVIFRFMNQLNNLKKQPIEDWHRADVVAALRKAGWTLRRLAVHNGYAPTSLVHALNGDTRRGEKIIADAIGIKPELIWPERFEKRCQKKLKKESTRSHK